MEQEHGPLMRSVEAEGHQTASYGAVQELLLTNNRERYLQRHAWQMVTDSMEPFPKII